jgi:hypothetical protein
MAVTRTFTNPFRDQSNAMAEALAEADVLLDQLVVRGRYARGAAPLDQEADCLRVTLALMPARRWGFEASVLVDTARRGFVLPYEGGALGERPGTDRPSSEGAC